jgi:hypothetical protein
LAGRLGEVILPVQVPDDVFHHDDRAVNNHAKIERAEREKIGRNSFKSEARRGEQKRERDRQRDDECAAHIPEEQEEDDHYQNDAFGEIVQDRVSRVMDQIAAINEWKDSYASR